MPATLARTAMLLILAAAGIGCGGDGGGGPTPDVLTTVEVTPEAAALFSLAPGNTVELSAVAKNQDGETMSGVPFTFSSENEAVATVDGDGLVTAAGAGTAGITASGTFETVTKSDISTVTVQDAPAAAEVTAPALTFLPGTTDVSAGGTVTWTFAAINHTVTFTSAGAPTNIPEFGNSSVSRDFPTAGTFSYRCDIHPTMTGQVRVH